LAEEQISVTVVTEKMDSRLPTERVEQGVRVMRWRCPGRPPFSSILYGLRGLWFLLRNRKYDLLHAHMLASPALLALGIGRIQRKPVLVKMAGANETGDVGTSSQSFRGKLKLWLFRQWAREIVAPSEEVAEECRRLQIPGARVHRIPNGVDTRIFVPSSDEHKTDMRKKLGLPAEGKIALYVGRWAKGKGLEEMLEVWEKGMERTSFSWVLMLVLGGECSPSSEIQSRLDALKGRIRIEKNIPNPVPYYQASDLAILISKGEGLSNFLLEAMACGLPSLTSEYAAVAGVDSGIVIPKSEGIVSRCLAELERLQNQPEELRSRGRRLREEVVKHFSLSAVAQTYGELYRDILLRHDQSKLTPRRF
jgi:glycosyltransferase involved in cell wall biosynthesis